MFFYLSIHLFFLGNEVISDFCVLHRLVHPDVVFNGDSKDAVLGLIGCGVSHFATLSIEKFSKIVKDLLRNLIFVEVTMKVFFFGNILSIFH